MEVLQALNGMKRDSLWRWHLREDQKEVKGKPSWRSILDKAICKGKNPEAGLDWCVQGTAGWRVLRDGSQPPTPTPPSRASWWFCWSVYSLSPVSIRQHGHCFVEDALSRANFSEIRYFLACISDLLKCSSTGWVFLILKYEMLRKFQGWWDGS